METITVFKAKDGKRFDNEKDCRQYEFLSELVDKAMQPLGKASDDSPFINGGGYYQHDLKVVKQIKDKVLNLANAKYGTNSSFGFIGRIMDDSGDRCLYYAWGRLISIDSMGREWGQPYYAINPGTGKNIQLNK